MGAWTFVEPEIEHVLTVLGAKHKRPVCWPCGGTSTATGLMSRHMVERDRLLQQAYKTRSAKRGEPNMASEIRVPTLGESVTEATIAQWYKKPGEAVSMDEPLCELETDKVTIEVPPKALAFWKRFCLRRARRWKLVLLGQLMLTGTPAAR